MKYLFLTIIFCSLWILNTPAENGPLHFSVIYLIHGDADYVYHDTSGNAHLADNEILKQALKIGEKLSDADVFIFYQGKASKFLFFPKDDSYFYYFRNGKKIEEDSYRRDKTDEDLSKEYQFYKQYSNNETDSTIKILLYYGHEIPRQNTSINSYNETHPEIKFNEELFSSAVKYFTGKKKFDLIVLSTCNNGTPEMVSRLSPYTKYLIASPEDLHLSQMNSLYLTELNTGKYQPYPFAKAFAENAFNYLKQNTLTVITISVYDIDKTKGYLEEVMKQDQQNKDLTSSLNNCDCSSFEKYRKPEMEDGVTVFYKPPAFGRNKNRITHSGWGCKSITE